jgi:mono/diheme cytochrome c family protein
MKRLLKIIGVILLLLVVFGILTFLYIKYTDIPSYSIEPIDYEVQSSAEVIARGKKLSLMLCANCHKNPETGKLTGTQMLDVPAEFGEIYSQNITQDKTYGIGDWTDKELLYLLRTGIKKDGQYSPPYMAKLPMMSDEDINAIIAFLRSDDLLVKADPTPDTPCEPSFLTKMLCRLAFKPYPMPSGPIAPPDTVNSVEWGEYLVHNLDCFACHSSDFKTNNYLDPKLSKGYFAGGNKPLDKQGRVKLTSNLTPDKETGIGSWSKEKFHNAVKSGLKENEPALSFPMMPYAQLSDKEIEAMYDYLMTIPPIKNKVERSIYE